MTLTRLQQRYLDSLVRLRAGPVTAWRILAFRPGPLLFLAAFLGFGIFCALGFVPEPGYFLTGLMTGAILRIITSARVSAGLWPVTKEILDWEKVEALREGK